MFDRYIRIGQICCTPGCNNNASNTRIRSLNLSRDNTIKFKVWINAIGRPDLIKMLEPGANPTKVFVCDIHFPDYMKFERGGTTRLIKSAFPKLHLPPLTVDISDSLMKKWVNISDNISPGIDMAINESLLIENDEINKKNEENNDNVIKINYEAPVAIEKDPLEMSISNDDPLADDNDPLKLSNNNPLKIDYSTSAVNILSSVPPPEQNIKIQSLSNNCLLLPSNICTPSSGNQNNVAGFIKKSNTHEPSTEASNIASAQVKNVLTRAPENELETKKTAVNFRKQLIVPLQKLPINNEEKTISFKNIQIVKKSLTMQLLGADKSPEIHSVNYPIKPSTTKTITVNKGLTIQNDTNLRNGNLNFSKANDFEQIDLTATEDVETDSSGQVLFKKLPKTIHLKTTHTIKDSGNVENTPVAKKLTRSVQTTDDFIPFELDQEGLSLVETLKIYNLQLTCRICFTSNDLVDIFHTKHENLKLHQILHELTNQKCAATGPRFVCQSCMDLIIQAYKFKTMFKRASIIAENVVARTKQIMFVQKDSQGIVFKPFTKTNTETFALLSSIGSPYTSTTAIVNSHLRGDKEYLSLANCLLCDFSWTKCLITVIRHYDDAHGVKLSFNMQTGECLACNVKMERLKLPQHFNSEEHKSKNLMCYLCFDSYPTEKVLKFHMSRNHDVSVGKIKNLSKDYPCILCKVTFDTFKEVDDHLDDCHPNVSQCIICNAAPKENYLKLHMMKHSPYGSRFCCRICRISFECFKHLQEHNQSVVHTFCNDCKVDYKTPKLLVKHMSKHRQCQCVCEHCGFIFSSKSSLDRHLEVHSDKVYYCEKCPAKFSNQSSLHTHQRRHEFVCQICEKNFSCEWKLILHTARHDVPTAVICRVRDCNKTFPSEAELAAHLPENHEALTCTTCNEKFYSQSNLAGHTAIHLWESTPEVDNPNECKLCKKLFNSEMNKLSHIRSKHRIFICNICPKMFSDNFILKSHQVQVHDLFIDPQWRVNRRKRHRNMYFTESGTDFEVARKRKRNNEGYEEMDEETNEEYKESNEAYEYEDTNVEYEEYEEMYEKYDEIDEKYEESDLKELYENQTVEWVVEDAGEGPSISYY